MDCLFNMKMSSGISKEGVYYVRYIYIYMCVYIQIYVCKDKKKKKLNNKMQYV